MESDDARPRRPWAASPANAKLRKDYVSRYSDYSSSRSAPQPPPPPPTTGPSARLRRPMAASPEHFRQRQQYRTLVRAALTAASKGDLSIVETLRRHSVSTFPKGVQSPPCGSLLEMATAVGAGEVLADKTQPPPPVATGSPPSQDAYAAASELAAPPRTGGAGAVGTGVGGGAGASAPLFDPGLQGGSGNTPTVNAITPYSGSASSTAVSATAGGSHASGLGGVATGVGAGGSTTRRVVRSSSARSMSAGGFGRTSAPHGFGDSGVLARSDGVPTDAEWRDLVRDADHAAKGGLPLEGFYGHIRGSEANVERGAGGGSAARSEMTTAEAAGGSGVAPGAGGETKIVTGTVDGARIDSIASVSVDAVAEAGAGGGRAVEGYASKAFEGVEAAQAGVVKVGANGGAPPIRPVQPPLDAAAEQAAAAAGTAGAAVGVGESLAPAPSGGVEGPSGPSAPATEDASSFTPASTSAFVRPSSAGAGSGSAVRDPSAARPASGSTTGGGASMEGTTPPTGGLSSHVAPSAHAASSTSSSSMGRGGSAVGGGVGVFNAVPEKRPQRVVGGLAGPAATVAMSSAEGRTPLSPGAAGVASSSRFSSRPMSAASGLWSDAGGGGEDERTPLDVVDDAELFAPSGSRRPPGSNSSRSPTPLMPGDDAVANALASTGAAAAAAPPAAGGASADGGQPSVRSVAGPAAPGIVAQAVPLSASAPVQSDGRNGAAVPAVSVGAVAGGDAASSLALAADLGSSALSVGGPASPQVLHQSSRTAVGGSAQGVGGGASEIVGAPALPAAHSYGGGAGVSGGIEAAAASGALPFSPADRVRDPGAPVRPVERARSAKRERRAVPQSEQHAAANAHLEGQQYAALLQQQLQSGGQQRDPMQQQRPTVSENGFVTPAPAPRPDEPSSTTATAASTVVGGGASHAASLPSRTSAFVPSATTPPTAPSSMPTDAAVGAGRAAVPLGGPLSAPHAALEQPMSLTARAALRDREHQSADTAPSAAQGTAGSQPPSQPTLSSSFPAPSQSLTTQPMAPHSSTAQFYAQPRAAQHMPTTVPPLPAGGIPHPQPGSGPFGGVGGVGVGVGPGSAPPGSLAASSGGGGGDAVAPDYGMTSMALRSYFGEVTAHELDTMASTLATAARVRDMAERERARAAFAQPAPAPNPSPHAGVWEAAGFTAPTAAPPAPARDVSPLPDPSEPYQRRVARACKELDSRNGSQHGSRSASASPYGRGGISALGAVPGVVFGSPEAALAALSAGGTAVPGGGVYHPGRAGRVVGCTTAYSGRHGPLRGGSAPPAGSAADLRMPSPSRESNVGAERGGLPSYIANGPVYVRAGAPADRPSVGAEDTHPPGALGGAAAIGSSAPPARPLATFFADVTQPAPTASSGSGGGGILSGANTSGGRRDPRVPRNGASIWAQ